MTKEKINRPRLKKSYLLARNYLICLILLSLTCFNVHVLQAQNKPLNQIEVTISPTSQKIGDTLQLKVKKIEEIKELPKVFLDKEKLPIFNLSNIFYRSLVPISANSKPGKHILEVFYSSMAKTIELDIQDTKYPIENLTLRKEVAALKASRVEKQLVAKVLSMLTATKYWTGKFTYPSNAKQTTPYGVKRRINGVLDNDYFHKGLDFAASEGSPIFAPENGKVVLTGHTKNGFVVNGNCIFIDHGHGVISGYLHLSEVLVKEEEFVNKGQIIGKVGSTGIASGPHLHWGVYVLGKTVDPLVWTKTTIE